MYEYSEPSENMEATPRDERVEMVQQYCDMDRERRHAIEAVKANQHQVEKLSAAMGQLRQRIGVSIDLVDDAPKAVRGDY